MKKRIGKVGQSVLILFTLLCIGLLIIEFKTQRPVRANYYEEKLKSAQIYAEATRIIKQERERLGLVIDEINDPNRTGLIGAQYTNITLERSDLSAALTSTNPNISAIFIELLKKMKLKSGDTIAVGLDGSFPGLNLALYSAIRTLGVIPIIITTNSSAMWGANNPNFTWLDIEKLLYNEKIFPFRSIAATLGGEDDLGRGFSPEARTQLENSIKSNNVVLISSENLNSNIEKRKDIYFSNGKIKAFVNIGKSVADVGIHRTIIPNGLVRHLSKKNSEISIISLMLQKKIPVINITDVNKIASHYGLPIAPVPLPTLGKGKLFIEPRFSLVTAFIFTVLIIILLYMVIRYDLEYYLTKNPKENK